MEEEIIKILKDPSEYKWQTAQTLSSKLSSYKNSTPAQIEEILINIVKSDFNNEIRYSTLPSKKTLQVLWGHIDKVGKRKLFDIYREDEQKKASYLNNIDDERNIFLSHSFKDTDKVFDLSNKLVNHGLNPWVAEADINLGHQINDEIINAINELPFFGIYLSKNILNSTWSAKEFEFAVRNKKKLFGFIEEDEYEIIDLIENNNPINHLDIHELLRRIFEVNESSEQIMFFVISKNLNSDLLKTKPLPSIRDYLL